MVSEMASCRSTIPENGGKDIKIKSLGQFDQKLLQFMWFHMMLWYRKKAKMEIGSAPIEKNVFLPKQNVFIFFYSIGHWFEGVRAWLVNKCVVTNMGRDTGIWFLSEL